MENPSTTVRCCGDCKSKMKDDPAVSVIELPSSAGCYCDEIDLDLMDPVECHICQDPDKSGCPMHLNYLQVSIS